MYRHFSCERHSWASTLLADAVAKSDERGLESTTSMRAMLQRIPHFSIWPGTARFRTRDRALLASAKFHQQKTQ